MLFTVGKNMDHGRLHFLATAWTMSMATRCSRTTNPDKALKGSWDHGHQPGPGWHCRTLTSMWPLEAARMDSNMASGNRTDHRHSQRVGIIIFLVVCVVGKISVWWGFEYVERKIMNRAVRLKHIVC